MLGARSERGGSLGLHFFVCFFGFSLVFSIYLWLLFFFFFFVFSFMFVLDVFGRHCLNVVPRDSCGCFLHEQCVLNMLDVFRGWFHVLFFP